MELVPPPPQAELIRAWLELQSEPRTGVEISCAIGRPKEVLVYQNVHRMFRDGMLARTGRCRHYAFTLLRDAIIRPRMPKDEYLRRAREADRKRRHRKGGQTMEQWRAEQAKRHAAWLARKAAEKAKRRADREAERAQREDERIAAKAAPRAPRPPREKPAPRPRATRISRAKTSVKPSTSRMRVLAPMPAPAPPEVRESVDEFLRRGGQVIHLSPGACSQPLRAFKEAA